MRNFLIAILLVACAVSGYYIHRDVDRINQLGVTNERVVTELAASKEREQGLAHKVGELEERVKALMTPDHAEALRLAATWPSICMKIPLVHLTGDQACLAANRAELEHRPFPTQEIILKVLENPQSVRYIRDFVIDRCALIAEASKRPAICKEQFSPL